MNVSERETCWQMSWKIQPGPTADIAGRCLVQNTTVPIYIHCVALYILYILYAYCTIVFSPESSFPNGKNSVDILCFGTLSSKCKSQYYFRDSKVRCAWLLLSLDYALCSITALSTSACGPATWTSPCHLSIQIMRPSSTPLLWYLPLSAS